MKKKLVLLIILGLFGFCKVAWAQWNTVYSESFTTNPHFISYATAFAYWDSINGNYYVNTYDNLVNKYWSHTPQFIQVRKTQDFIFECDFNLENIAFGTYTGIYFYNNTPFERTDTSRAFSITVAYSAYHGKQLQIIDDNGNVWITSVLTENNWYHFNLSYNSTNHTINVTITDLSDNSINTSIINASFAPHSDFRFMAVGYYDDPDYGSEWAPIRIDDVIIKSYCSSPVPQASDDHSCGSGSVTLIASGGTNYFWYDTPNSGIPIGTGFSFTTPVITATHTFYVTNNNGTCESGKDTVIAFVFPLPFDIGQHYYFNQSHDPNFWYNDGLVAYYPFNGNANDESGNGNNGTVNGAVLTGDRCGNNNAAYSFNGIGDYIQVNNSSSFPQTAISICFWLNRYGHVPATLENYISKDNAFQTYVRPDSHFESGLYSGNPGNWSVYKSDYAVLNNFDWVFYTFTFDNATHIASTYINGALDTSLYESNPNYIVRVSSYPMYIGRNGSASVYYIKGSMDDIRIYDRVLTDCEIKELYNEICGVTLNVALDKDSICSNSQAEIQISNPQIGISYQLFLNGNPIGSSQVASCDTLFFSTGPLTSNTVATITATDTSTLCSIVLDTSLLITVNPNLPVNAIISAVPSGAICAGTSVTFTLTPTNEGTSPIYHWQVNGLDVGTNSLTFTSSTLANGDVVHCILNSSIPCSSGNPDTSNTISMTVNPNLIANVNISANPSAICAGQNVTFTATPSNGGTTPSYQWLQNGNIVGTNNPTFTSSALSNGDSVLCILNSNAPCAVGNPSSSDTILMIVYPLPVPVISGPSSFCAGNSIVLGAGAGYSFYDWSSGDTTQTINVSASGTYTVTVFDTDGCSGIASKVVVQNLNPAPVISGPSSFCTGDSISLDVGFGYATIHWSTNDSSHAIVVSNGGTYAVVVTDTNGCSGMDSVVVSQNNNPVPDITGLLTICTGNFSILEAGSGYSSYTWSTSATLQSINVATSGLYSVTVANIAGCTGSDAVNVNVVSALPANAWPDTTIYLGESMQLNTSGGTSWNWSPETGLSCTACPDPIASPEVTTIYTVIIIDSNGCVSTDIVTINIDINCGNLLIPNIFSPNGDNANDVLYIRSTCIKTLTFLIYDRWGENVFVTSDPLEGWDGKFRGKPMDEGVFYYYLKAELHNNKEIIKKGTITLIR